MHLSILIETMRREGYEFQVSTPHVLNKMVDGKLCEPIERMVADVPENSVGAVIDKISQRKGELVTMTPDRQPDAVGVPCADTRIVRLPQSEFGPTRGEGHHGLRAGQLCARQG